MNQNILFNDDLIFDHLHEAWKMTGQHAGQLITVYFHSIKLKQLGTIDTSTQYDLEELTELWFENNELESDEIHIPA